MKKKTSIMLSDETKQLLELISKIDVRSQSSEIEFLILKRADELKINYHRKED